MNDKSQHAIATDQIINRITLIFRLRRFYRFVLHKQITIFKRKTRLKLSILVSVILSLKI